MTSNPLSNPPVAPAEEPTVLHAVQNTAKNTPDAIAVVDQDGTHTHSEVATLSRDLRCHIQNHGVTSGMLVGVLLDRDVTLPAALLAVFGAGASYLPLDKGDPTERHIRAISRLDCKVVLGSRASLVTLRDTMLAETPRPLPDFIHIEDVLPASDAAPALVMPVPTDTAYVLLTSGSTGDPKAVNVTHANVITLINSSRDLLGVTADDRYLATSPLTFDASIPEVFLPLTTGAAIVVRERDLVLSPVQLASEIRDHGVTIAQTTPSTWSAILRSVPDFPRLRLLISHGEAISPAFARDLSTKADTVLNMYGPTETTVWATAHRLTADMPEGASAGSAPIGTPLAHFTTLILSADGTTCGADQPGELCLGGPSVTKGYRNDADRTAKVFVNIDGTRFYRTGDLVQQTATGVIEYLGRIDDQMAINGLRIEPGEIETAILTHSAVTQAAVTWYPVSDDQRAIVAAIVSPTALSSGDLRGHLEAKIGRAMLPARILTLDSLPTLTSGKIDSKTIRAMAVEAGGDMQASATDDLSEIEATVAQVWCDVLRIGAVSALDDFFLVGGDSLAAVEMTDLLEKALDRPVPIDVIFETSQLRAFAASLEVAPDAPPADPSSTMLQVKSTATGNPLFFALADYGYVGRAGKNLPCPFFNLTVWNRSDGIINMGRLEDMAARYRAEIQAKQPQGPYQLAGYSVGGMLVYEVARQLIDAGEQVSMLFLLDATPPTKLMLNDSTAIIDGTGSRGLKRRARRVPGDLRNLSMLPSYRRVNKTLRSGAPSAAAQIDKKTRYYAMRYALGRMAARYVARPIDAPVTLVSGNDDIRKTWSRLLGSALDIHDVTQNHRDVWKEPDDAVWTQVLLGKLQQG